MMSADETETIEMKSKDCANTAMLSGAAARVRDAACSAGNVKQVVGGSMLTTPAVTIAPSHSRT